MSSRISPVDNNTQQSEKSRGNTSFVIHYMLSRTKDKQSVRLLMCYFATRFSHLRPSSGVYKQQNAPKFITKSRLSVAMDLSLIVLPCKTVFIELQCLSILKYLSKISKAYLNYCYFFKNDPIILPRVLVTKDTGFDR